MLWSMKNHLRFCLPALLLVLLAACSTPQEAAPPETDVSGDWAGTATIQVLNETIPVRLELEQAGADVTGQLHVDDPRADQAAGSVAGSVAGTEVTLSLSFLTAVVDAGGSFRGTVSGSSFQGRGNLSLENSGRSLPVRFSLTRQ